MPNNCQTSCFWDLPYRAGLSLLALPVSDLWRKQELKQIALSLSLNTLPNSKGPVAQQKNFQLASSSRYRCRTIVGERWSPAG